MAHSTRDRFSTEQSLEVDKVSSSKQPTAESDSGSFCETLTSCRWILGYIGCLCYTMIYAMRTNMSIAIICMVKAENYTESLRNTSHASTCGLTANNYSHPMSYSGGEIEWSKTTQGWVLSAFFYGYLVSQVPCGILAGRFGGKRVMLYGVSLFGVTTLLVPLAARFDGNNHNISAVLVIILRVISGVSCGVVSPALYSLLGQWLPVYERSKLTVITVSGQMLGSILILGVGGFFCQWESFDGGWPSIFYISGGLSLIFCVVWWFTVFDSPSKHPRISMKELEYIKANTDHITTSKKNHRVPWLKIISSRAVWAVFVGHMTFNFGHYAVMTKLPAYMKEVLGLDIQANGLYSTLPHIMMFIMANLASHTVDKLRQSNVLSTSTARKTAMAIALIIPAGFLVGAGYIPCDKSYLGIVFLTIAVGFTGLVSSGYGSNFQDIAARYSGEIYGISNMFATIPGIVAPMLVNTLTPNGTVEEWRVVFYIWAAVFVFGAIFFAVFAEGETQSWCKDEAIPPHEGQDSCAKNDEEKIDTLL